MSVLLDKVRLDASQLPRDEQQLLAIELIDSAWGDYESQEAVEAAWDSEIAKRVEEVRSGAVELQSWASVKTSLAKEFDWDKQPPIPRPLRNSVCRKSIKAKHTTVQIPVLDYPLPTEVHKMVYPTRHEQ